MDKRKFAKKWQKINFAQKNLVQEKFCQKKIKFCKKKIAKNIVKIILYKKKFTKNGQKIIWSKQNFVKISNLVSN